MRTDIVRTYKDIHSWVGIICGLALFIAFYAGAITMFEAPLQRWATPPIEISEPPALEQTPELIKLVQAEYPEAKGGFDVVVETGLGEPARVRWSGGGGLESGVTYYASLDRHGRLEVESRTSSPVADFIDVLHQQVGLPFDQDVSMIIMGFIAMLYAVAIISGFICLLPSLVKDLFALRFGKNVKRMWLDIHNSLGLFSMPFHIVMALTSVTFAFHDQIYDVEQAVRSIGAQQAIESDEHDHSSNSAGAKAVIAPAELIDELARQAPGFEASHITYRYSEGMGDEVMVVGENPQFLRSRPAGVFVEVNAYTGAINLEEDIPGKQSGWDATISSFFALHFGSYGGEPVRWSYFVLGIAGAFIFYTGNLLWVESHRRKDRKSGPVEQSGTNRILAALTVGVPLGCISGLSLTIAAAKWLPRFIGDLSLWHSGIYYFMFVFAVIWSLVRGAARSGRELLWIAAITTALIPLTSLLSSLGVGWSHADNSRLVDLIALVGMAGFIMIALSAQKRGVQGPSDSVWSSAEPRLKEGRGSKGDASSS
ncbi:MAG: PepSY-associated TM helix domain-containing protein [Sphingomonadaceae bacterium]